MAKNVPDFAVTELFGCQPGYPLNTKLCPPGQGYHHGIDYGCPSGTPITVNGVTIGISGATGAVTGPHCHVGKWVGGKSVNPGVGNGFSFKSAVVSEVGQNNIDGKYVALNADGARWVYLHMSDNSKVKVGQKLEGGSDMPVTKEQEMAESYAIVGSYPGNNYDFRYTGTEDYNGMISFWAGQQPRITKEMEKQVAEGCTGIASVIGKDYNSQFVDKPVVNHYPKMVAFWNGQPKAGGYKPYSGKPLFVEG